MTLPMVVGGAVLAALGLLFGRVFVANFELDNRGKVRKALGILAVVAGALLVLRGAGSIGPPPARATESGVVWTDDLAAAEAWARAEGRPLLVDFSAEWCKACKELEAHTFAAAPVADRLAGWVTVRLDLTHDRPDLEAAQRRFQVMGLPTVAFVSADGTHMTEQTLTGFEPADAFLARMDRVESGTAGAEPTLADRIRAALESHSVWVYLLVFLAGVVGSLSPCVYPLIPITISLFGARKAPTRAHGFLLSLVYVLGIAATYSVLGVVAASTGSLFGSALQSGWVVGTVAVVFVAMGLSMLGVFEIRLPGGLSDRLNQVGGGQGGRLLGIFLMGSVAGIVAAPCVGPPLVVVLTFVATQGDLTGGLRLLVVYSLGLGLLFMVLGTFTQLIARMPRSGGWMEVVKGSLGIVMLVVGAVYLADVLPIPQ